MLNINSISSLAKISAMFDKIDILISLYSIASYQNYYE
jgi:hypothetical protein